MGNKVRKYQSCLICGKKLHVKPSHLKRGEGKFCSRICQGLAQSEKQQGSGNPNWKGGIRRDSYGYFRVLLRDHPAADPKGYVLMHRLVMEQELGRYLKPEEVVHHANEDISDNRPKNLRLFPSNVEHLRYHNRRRYK